MKIHQIEHLSASSIKAYKQCPFKFFLQYILKIAMPSNYPADLGSFIHDIFEQMANGTIDGNTWIDYAKSKVNTLYEIAKKDKNKNPEEVWIDVDWLVHKVLDRPDKLNPLKWEILGAEKKFKEKLQSGCIVKGFMDLVIEEDKDTLLILDWKTGKHALSQKEAHKDPQVLTYRIAAEILYPGYKYYNICLDYLQKRPVWVAPSDKMVKGAHIALGRYWKKLTAMSEAPRRQWEEPNFRCIHLCSRSICDKYWNKIMS